MEVLEEGEQNLQRDMTKTRCQRNKRQSLRKLANVMIKRVANIKMTKKVI